MQNDIQLFYDLTAEKTADEWYRETVLMPTLQEFIGLFPKAPRILDYGCGTGHESMRLSSLGAQVVGIDFSEKCIQTAKLRTPQCAFYAMDFRDNNRELGLFDGIFACASLIHIAPHEMLEVLKNMRSLVKTEGYVSMIIKDGEGIHKEWSLLEVDGEKLDRTVYLYTKRQLRSSAGKTGFTLVKEGFLAEELKAYGWKNYIFRAHSE